MCIIHGDITLKLLSFKLFFYILNSTCEINLTKIASFNTNFFLNCVLFLASDLYICCILTPVSRLKYHPVGCSSSGKTPATFLWPWFTLLLPCHKKEAIGHFFRMPICFLNLSESSSWYQSLCQKWTERWWEWFWIAGVLAFGLDIFSPFTSHFVANLTF